MKRALLFLTFISIFRMGHAQAFMNGSFENNTAGTDQINMSNPAFNAMMANTVAFGTFGDMDIISSATYCGLAQNGLWYTALTGSNTDMITMQLAAPLVMGNTYTITYWDKGCWPTFSGMAPPVQLGLGTVPGVLGTTIYTGPTPTNTIWTQHSATFVAPNNGQYISVTLTTGSTGDWTQIDNFEFASVAAPVANFIASNQNICVGDCIDFTDMSTGGPTSWSWTFAGSSTASSTNQNPTNICYPTAGTYAVTLTATNGSGSNTLNQTTYITVNAPPTVTAVSGGNLSCSITSTTLTGTSAGSTMVWNGGALTNAANPATVTAAGTYTCTATNAAGCTATTTLTITNSGILPTVTATSSGTITCTSPSVTLTGTSVGNTMVWNGGSLSNAANPATVTAAGTYTCTATDPVTGCQNTTTVTVTANTTPPTVTATAGSITCITTSATLTGTSTGTMVWNGGALSNAANPASVTAAGTYTVTSTDPSNGCTSTATVTVIANNTPPTLTASASGPISCLNPTTTLTGAAAGSTIVWNGGALSNSPNPSVVSAAGSYTCTAVNIANGCTATFTVTITANTTPPVLSVAPADTITCAMASVPLSGTSSTAGATFAWTGPGIVSGSNAASCLVNAGGTYTCTVTDPANGCTTVMTVVVVANVNPPTASVSGGTTISYGNSAVLTATGGGTYAWTPTTGLSCTTCASPTASPTQTTTYCTIVTDALGCTDSACTTVIVDITCGTFDFPNAFSPNGSGINDYFRSVMNPGCLRDYHLVVYDRWGELVFETEDYTQGWDGTFKGKDLDDAVFVYYATATLTTTGEKLERKGNVSLIR